jgi:hypothetical protein
MIGDRLHRVARRVLRAETCRTIVEPAIADLQHEASHGTRWRLRGYVGVCRAVTAAMIGEIAVDCAATARRAPLADLAVPVLSTAALATLFHGRFVWDIGSSPRPWHHDVVLLALYTPFLFALVAPWVTLPLAAVLARARHAGARRGAILLSASLMILVVFVSERAAIALHPLRRDLAFSSVWSVRDGHGDRPIWVVRDLYRARLDELRAGERGAHEPSHRFLVFASHRDAALAFTCLTFAIAGITFASGSTLLLILLAGGVSLAHVATMLAFTRVLYVQAVTGWASAIWAPVVLVFLAFAWIAVRVPERPA